MGSKRKFVVLTLVTMLLLGLFSACSSTTQQDGGTAEDSSSSPNSNGTPSESDNNVQELEPFEVTVAMPVMGAIPADMEAVQAEISKITKEKINATVKFLPISIGTYGQQINLMSTSGEKLDTYVMFGQGYAPEVAAGKFIELDSLLENYGKELKEQIGEDYVRSAAINGKIYGVPVLKDFTTGYASLAMDKALVEKHNIDVAAIKSIDDLDQVFQTIKDNEPNVAPLGVGLSVPSDKYFTYDKLGDRFGVLPGFDNGLKVENLFESEEYEAYLTKIHSWYKAGFINKDAATSQTNPADLVKAGKAFSFLISDKPGALAGESRMAGKELVSARILHEAYATTGDTLLALWGISSNSTNPERTMMFLNLLYSDPEIANLMLWGIEGKHYVKTSDTSIDYPEGIDVTTVGYANQAWLIGNPLLTYTFKGEPLDKSELTREANANATKSKALGFLFDSTPVNNEITALNNVVNQYRGVLETGTLNPADKLQEFRSKLKAAGIDKVIAEKQKQLDAWAAQNK
ncbi:ABC transporter substrate-binding protein [Paenibacillus sp.]|uniref:ABC transporter substrate-binding protein n=1 Tax=Paenibacillus sp. TaxID=58172 RepID=UPI002D2EA65F|nr:ABC transporter substrate-binding protein [Paenibacillus sp.]HZG87990.1 ABC transporter substrate-binding protein [Paenibacillus sp.]